MTGTGVWQIVLVLQVEKEEKRFNSISDFFLQMIDRNDRPPTELDPFRFIHSPSSNFPTLFLSFNKWLSGKYTQNIGCKENRNSVYNMQMSW